MAPQHNHEDRVQYFYFYRILDVTLLHAIQLTETPFDHRMFCCSIAHFREKFQLHLNCGFLANKIIANN